MEVLLSASVGACSEDMGEHGALVTAVANAFVGKQTGNALNSMAIRVLHCKCNTITLKLFLNKGCDVCSKTSGLKVLFM